MIHPSIRRELALRYHRALPDEIRSCLKDRGIPATLIEQHRLGWSGERITVPIFGRERDVLGFRYATVPQDPSERPEILSDLGLEAELYGWDTLVRTPQRVVICAGEFDRLVLEAHGFPAVASTGTPPFQKEWLPYFEPIKNVYMCFNRDLSGAAAARNVQRLLPRARIVTLPPDVGQGGSATDFFVTLGLTKIDFELLLAAAESAADDDPADKLPTVREFRPLHKSKRRRAESLKRAVRLHDVVSNYIDLQASGTRLVGHCLFHDDSTRSFSVYPETNTYRCSVCGAEGDVIRFLMDKESMTFGQALEALERFRYSHELYGTS